MTDKPIYAEGGYIGPQPPGMQRYQLSAGCVLMSHASYKALGKDMIEKLFPGQQVELVISADEVRELGTKFLDELNE